MTPRTHLVLLTAAILSNGMALAQPNAGKELTTVSYPVVDLVVPLLAHRQTAQVTTRENELMACIRKKVAPATWEHSGGQGSMRYEPKEFMLQVRQVPEVHAELKSFLKKLEREQVSVETRIISVAERNLEGLKIPWTQKDGIESALLDDLKLIRFLESVQADRAAHILQLPKITLFDGQEATLQAGVQARLLPTISADRRHITVQAKIGQENASSGDFQLAVRAKVPDQRTVAILAGATSTDVIRTDFTSPLSRIPYVSRLVRTVGYSRESVKLIVLLTPRILREPEEEAVEVQPLQSIKQPEDNGKFPLILPQAGR